MKIEIKKNGTVEIRPSRGKEIDVTTTLSKIIIKENVV